MLASGLGQDFLPSAEAFTGKLFTPVADYRWKTCTFAFLPQQSADVVALANHVRLERPDIVLVGLEDQFTEFMGAVANFAREKSIISAGVAITLLTQIALREARESANAKEKKDAGDEQKEKTSQTKKT